MNFRKALHLGQSGWKKKRRVEEAEDYSIGHIQKNWKIGPLDLVGMVPMKNNEFRHQVKSAMQLGRIWLSLAVTVSAFVGYIIIRRAIFAECLYFCAGVFFCAVASSALNQLIERDYDARMDRTKFRPLPMHIYSSRQVLIAAAALTITGIFLIGLFTTLSAALLTIFNLGWYIAVYTPLKRKTHHAVFIGAINGALPPVIGAIAAGSHLTVNVLCVAIFMYLWQIPHFLLIAQRFKSEYENAGFPTSNSNRPFYWFRFNILGWSLLTSGSTFFFIKYGIISGRFFIVALIAGSLLVLSYTFNKLIWNRSLNGLISTFRGLNFYQGFVQVIVIAASLYKV